MIKTIKQTLILSLFTVTGLTATSVQAEPEVKLVGKSDCFSGAFASYESWMKKIAQMNRDKPNTEKILKKVKAFYKKEDFKNFQENLECKNFIYKVNEAMVHGYYIAPKGQSDLPVIIYNRGGNGSFSSWIFPRVYNKLFELADEKNVAIFASNYRGAAPKLPGKDEFGGADVNDVVALPQLFEHFPNVNPENVGLFGFSRGAMQSLLAVKHGLSVDSIVLHAGQYDLFEGQKHRPEMERVHKARIPGYEQNKDEELKKRSAVFWMDEIDNDIPILLIHGDRDKRVLVNSSIGLDKVLEKEGFTHKLSIYDGLGHSSFPRQKEIREEMMSWFRKYWE
ncbi:prolyl oligopeptidase family protein [Idiomarina loihiensis]|uniref:alpha/beta hydrolase family protein n=1 Tax=Idiomarina TaxID=135575 RepID=UPI000D70A9F2|nr:MULTISPECIES: prolyl oligopeptidase family serine peptidase [Idiomarina]PWW39458.1 prolyl oligopeptidase family protein [Idiomarina loihiensis]TDP49447.1 prolyl oligopeptidase family protein [Idiomarina loihiensis]TDS24239.1 prolyl oligopeptidase family protein [Idiomarina sp. H2]